MFCLWYLKDFRDFNYFWAMLDIPVTSQYLWKRICICQQCLSHAVLHISIMKHWEIALESDLGYFHQRLNQGHPNSLVSVTVDGTKVSWIFVFYTPYQPVISAGWALQYSWQSWLLSWCCPGHSICSASVLGSAGKPEVGNFISDLKYTVKNYLT